MLNIFPVEEKKKILAAYRLRLGVVAVFTVSALILSSSILLAPSYLLAVSKYNSVSRELLALELEQGSTEREKEVNIQIRDENKKIDLFLKGGDDGWLSPSGVIWGIVGKKGDAIKIRGFMYEASANKERLVITGTADDREGMASFVGALKKEQTFTKVELPIQSYVKSSDIDFSVVVERIVKSIDTKK